MALTTYLKNWLILTRVQSIPVTVTSLIIAYFTVQDNILVYEVLPLIIIGGVSHLSVYGLNDVFDYFHDIEHKNNTKPLVSGAISYTTARILCWMLVGVSAVSSIIFLKTLSSLFILISLFIGILYNKYSKVHTFSALYLGLWGVVITLSGAYQAGTPSIYTYTIALILAIHMVLMTIEGDIKDFHANEPTIPRALDCTMWKNGDKNFIRFSIPFLIYWCILSGTEILIISTLSTELSNYISWIVITFCLFSIIPTHKIIHHGSYNPNKIKKNIVLREILIVVACLIASIVFMDIYTVTALVIGTIIWGLGWQKILYGSSLYFP